MKMTSGVKCLGRMENEMYRRDARWKSNGMAEQ